MALDFDYFDYIDYIYPPITLKIDYIDYIYPPITLKVILKSYNITDILDELDIDEISNFVKNNF